jgi:hypothetical protein
MQRKTLALSAVLAAGAIAGTAAPASAASPPPSLTVVKNAAIANINAKLLWSGVVDYVFATDKNVTPVDRAALLPRSDADSSTLKALLADVQRSTTITSIRAYMTNVASLQILAFVLPQLTTVRDSDDLAAGEAALAGKEAAYKTAITSAANAHKNVAAAQTALVDYTAHVTAAEGLTATAHHAVTLTIATPGAAFLTAVYAVDNFKAALHVLAAVADVKTITLTTGPVA